MKQSVRLKGHDLEHLIVTIETSLRINNRSQFFLWAQGALQGFIPHETLLCAHGDISSQWLSWHGQRAGFGGERP